MEGGLSSGGDTCGFSFQPLPFGILSHRYLPPVAALGLLAPRNNQ